MGGVGVLVFLLTLLVRDEVAARGIGSCLVSTKLATFNAALAPFFRSVNGDPEIDTRAARLIQEVKFATLYNYH